MMPHGWELLLSHKSVANVLMSAISVDMVAEVELSPNSTGWALKSQAKDIIIYKDLWQQIKAPLTWVNLVVGLSGLPEVRKNEH